jgi:hypothetical protein
VARTLRLSDGAIERLARHTEAVVKATPGLRPSKAAGVGFMAEPADALFQALQPSQWLLAQYGYHFYPPGSPPTNLNQLALKEEARATAQQRMAAEAQGSYSAASSLTQHLRASSLLLGASTAAAAGGVGVLQDKLRRLHEVRPPLLTSPPHQPQRSFHSSTSLLHEGWERTYVAVCGGAVRRLRAIMVLDEACDVGLSAGQVMGGGRRTTH